MVEITDFIEIDKVTDNDMLNGPPAYEDVVNQTPENTRYIKRETKTVKLIYNYFQNQNGSARRHCYIN